MIVIDHEINEVGTRGKLIWKIPMMVIPFFYFLLGRGLTQNIFWEGAGAGTEFRCPPTPGRHLQSFAGLFGGQQAHVEIVESHQCRTSPSFGAGFSNTGSEPCKCGHMS